jgi:hypothetical protein
MIDQLVLLRHSDSPDGDADSNLEHINDEPDEDSSEDEEERFM